MQVFDILSLFDAFIWRIGFFVVLLIGIFLTLKSKFFQFCVLCHPRKHVCDLLAASAKNLENASGVHPLMLYFTSVGGMIGLGNIVTVVTMLSIGGPGSLFWLWVTSFLGMIVKYSEVFLGITYRVKTPEGNYDGGPMYYLQEAFPKSGKVLAIISCILLCIYGVEVSQFTIIADTISDILNINKFAVVAVVLILLLISAVGGVKRLSKLCTVLIPPLMLSYICIGLYIIVDHSSDMLSIIIEIFSSAFKGFTPAGSGLAGGMLLTAQQGASRSVYSADIGIGYDSITQSETRTTYPEKQAKIAVFTVVSDVLICTISVLIVLLTNVWTADLKPSQYVAKALASYIPFTDIYIVVLFFIAGFTTVAGYLVVGQKCAKFLNRKFGKKLYIAYASMILPIFAFFSQETVILIMTASGGCLMILNLIGVLKLHNKIRFR